MQQPRLSASTRTPYALASQSLGPFRWPNGPCVRYFLDRAELVYIRERRTAAILADLGVRPDRIEVAPDVAFTLPAASAEPIWAGERMDPDRIPRPWVALSVSALVLGLRHMGQRYLREMIELSHHLRRRYDASVFLVPHEISPTGLGSDDRSAASVLRARMGGPRWLYTIQGDYGPDVLKGLISRCDAVVAARMHAAIAREALASGRPAKPPLCLISGGETTVTLRGEGLGGRNQEFVLAAAIDLAGAKHVVVLSGGTDGTDGPTDAAGAIADGLTVSRAQASDLAPAKFLAANDSYHFFEALGDLLKTGPTNTNVMDVRLILASAPAAAGATSSAGRSRRGR